MFCRLVSQTKSDCNKKASKSKPNKSRRSLNHSTSILGVMDIVFDVLTRIIGFVRIFFAAWCEKTQMLSEVPAITHIRTTANLCLDCESLCFVCQIQYRTSFALGEEELTRPPARRKKAASASRASTTMPEILSRNIENMPIMAMMIAPPPQKAP